MFQNAEVEEIVARLKASQQKTYEHTYTGEVIVQVVCCSSSWSRGCLSCWMSLEDKGLFAGLIVISLNSRFSLS